LDRIKNTKYFNGIVRNSFLKLYSNIDPNPTDNKNMPVSVAKLGVPFLPDAIMNGASHLPTPEFQVDTKTFASLIPDQPNAFVHGSIFKAVTGTSDPVASAKKAWQERRLWQEGLRITRFPNPVSQNDFKGISAWENGWREYATSHPVEMTTPKQRQTVKDSITAKFDESFMERSPLSVTEILEKCTDAELSALHSAALLIEFFGFQNIYFEGNALITDFLERGAYNCASIALVSLHLLQNVGITSFQSVSIPKHTTLALKLESGLIIYLNNGQELLPPNAFDNPDSETGYAKMAHEIPHPAWQALSFIHANKGMLAANHSSKATGKLLHNIVALLIDPQNATAQVNIGFAFNELGLSERAKKAFFATVDLNPFYASPFIGLALLFAQEGLIEEAFTTTRMAENLSSDKAFPWRCLGEQLRTLGKYVEAVLAFEEVLNTKPHGSSLDVNAHYWLGRCFHDLKDLAKAETHFLACLQHDSNPRIYNDLGVVYEEIGDIEHARQCFRFAMELKPNETIYVQNYRRVIALGTNKRR
jgi:tetratricopeptide (TPR) repeat protein